MVKLNVKHFISISIIFILVMETIPAAGSSNSSSFEFISYSQQYNNITGVQVYTGWTYVKVFNYINYTPIIRDIASNSMFHIIQGINGEFYWIGAGNLTMSTPLEIGDLNNFTLMNYNVYYRTIYGDNVTSLLISGVPTFSSDDRIYLSSVTPTFMLFMLIPLSGPIKELQEVNDTYIGNFINYQLGNNFIENLGFTFGNISIQPIYKIVFNGEIEDENGLISSNSQIASVDDNPNPEVYLFNIYGNSKIILNPGFNLSKSNSNSYIGNNFIIPILGRFDRYIQNYSYFDIFLNKSIVGYIYAPSDSQILKNSSMVISDPLSYVRIIYINTDLSPASKYLSRILYNSSYLGLIYIGKNISYIPINSSYAFSYSGNMNEASIFLLTGHEGMVIVAEKSFLRIKYVQVNGMNESYRLVGESNGTSFYEVPIYDEGPQNVSVYYVNTVQEKIKTLFNSFLIGGIVLILASVSTILVAYVKHRRNAKKIIMN